MRFALSILLGLWALYSFQGCAMIDSLRDESASIDAESNADRDREGDTLQEQQTRMAERPRTLKGLSANNVPSYEPPVSRGYGRRLSSLADQDGPAAPPEEGYHRVTRQDFVDSQARENSLWDAQGQGNYLFSNNRRREVGDLVTGEVEKDLKREIQYQLWMTLPPEQRKVKRKPASTAAGAAAAPEQTADAGKSNEEKQKDAAAEAAKTNMPTESKEDDIVRMEVVESLGNGLVRVVGQKRVIYRGVSRVVEVMALVNNKDVDDNNRVKSSSFLDMKTQVIQ